MSEVVWSALRSAIGSTAASFVLILLVVSGGVGVASMMQSGARMGGVASNNAADVLIHVVNETSGQPYADFGVLAGPASSPDDFFPTFGGGWTTYECSGHEVPSGSVVWANGTVVLPNGTEIAYTSCPLRIYTTNSTGWVSIPNVAGKYYFFEARPNLPVLGDVIYGIVQLHQGVETQVTVNLPNCPMVSLCGGNYTVAYYPENN